MNHGKIAVSIITLLLGLILLSGCASAKGVPEMNTWRSGYNTSYTNARITFKPGDKCGLEQLRPTANNELFLEVVVNDQKYENYSVVAESLVEGKTVKDLQDYTQKNPESIIPPYFVNLEAAQIVSPMSRTLAYAHLPTGSIYFTCIIQGPDKQRSIENLGPVEIME